MHGDAGLHQALRATEALFGGDLDELSADEIAAAFNEVSTVLLDFQVNPRSITQTDAIIAFGSRLALIGRL